jgi:hypothetical protein
VAPVGIISANFFGAFQPHSANLSGNQPAFDYRKTFLYRGKTVQDDYIHKIGAVPLETALKGAKLCVKLAGLLV